MHKVFKLLILAFIAINIVFCAWYVLHNDILFHTDISRDFLLLQEIDEKKLVLLGPRSSTSGLFHGPLWLYLNYPAFVIGQGNPLSVGWFWIFLIITFLVTSFFIAKKLFDETTAYLFTLFLSVFLIFEARGLFNPHGAFFLLPAFFFFFIQSFQTMRIRNLLIFLFIAGCIIQFQMAIGIPLLMLASIPLCYKIIKTKKFTHLLAFFILLIPLSTFILFDLKHQFIQLHSVFSYIFSDNLNTEKYGNFLGLLSDRFNFLTNAGIGVFKNTYEGKNIIAAMIIAVFLLIQLKDNKYRTIYLSFIYLYIGYYALSLVNKTGGMLYHYYVPLFPLVFLIFASFITSRYKLFFFVIFLFVYLTNFQQARLYIANSQTFFGKDQNSWKFLSEMGKEVYKGPENEFGYFIYMPDSLAYQPKYAVSYVARHSTQKALSFQKKSITYLVIAPPPADNPHMKDNWWKVNQVRITNAAESTATFSNGYKIEKYVLSAEEQRVSFDPAIDTGIHFR
jgi:hypothetical protein